MNSRRMLRNLIAAVEQNKIGDDAGFLLNASQKPSQVCSYSSLELEDGLGRTQKEFPT